MDAEGARSERARRLRGAAAAPRDGARGGRGGTAIVGTALPIEERDGLARAAAEAGERMAARARRALLAPVEIDPETRVATLGGVPLGVADPALGSAGGGAATVRVSMREGARDALAGRAARAGMSVSEYARAVLRLPLAVDGASVPGRAEACVLTDAGLRELSEQVRRIGVNYNQTVRALNALVRTLGSELPRDRDEWLATAVLVSRAREATEAVGGAMGDVAEAVRELGERARAMVGDGRL